MVERNYLRKWGEIDIVARKANVIHFIEVKSVSCVTAKDNPLHDSQETYRPEDNMHPRKIGRLIRTMQTYIMEKGLDQGFQLDLITVKINMDTRKARVEIIENVGI